MSGAVEITGFAVNQADGQEGQPYPEQHSSGEATSPVPGGGAELIQRADQALYTARAEGRNRHVLAS
jgi:GGDEF domain-containing protein